MYSAFPRNCSVSYLSFVYGRSLWAELNGGENSLHWNANMLPLFSILTLWFELSDTKLRNLDMLLSTRAMFWYNIDFDEILGNSTVLYAVAVNPFTANCAQKSTNCQNFDPKIRRDHQKNFTRALRL